jgi:hypothetical protein
MKSIVMQMIGVGAFLVTPWAHADVASSDDVRLNFVPADAVFQFEGVEANADRDDETPLLAMLQDDAGGFGPQSGDWEFILSGAGSSDEDFDTNTFGVTFSIGYFFTEALELALRQSVFISSNGSTDASGTTRVVLDYHFDLDCWRPFVGGSLGATYGDVPDDTFLGGFEGGAKWYVKPETFIFGMVELLWLFDSDDDAQWVYTLGIGFNF